VSSTAYWGGVAGFRNSAQSFYIDTLSGTQLQIRWVGSSGNGQVSPAITPGVWHHVVATYGGSSNSLIVYIDGNKVGSEVIKNGGTLTDSTLVFDIGNNMGLSLAGAVDEVALYDVALTAAEVSAHYAAGSQGAADGGSRVVITVATGNKRSGVTTWPMSAEDKVKLLYRLANVSGENMTRFIMMPLTSPSNGTHTLEWHVRADASGADDADVAAQVVQNAPLVVENLVSAVARPSPSKKTKQNSHGIPQGAMIAVIVVSTVVGVALLVTGLILIRKKINEARTRDAYHEMNVPSRE